MRFACILMANGKRTLYFSSIKFMYFIYSLHIANEPDSIKIKENKFTSVCAYAWFFAVWARRIALLGTLIVLKCLLHVLFTYSVLFGRYIRCIQIKLGYTT